MARVAAWVIGLIVVVGLSGRLIDVKPLAAEMKGDYATYVAMAFSLARDGDLRYDARDYQRFVSVFGHGPSGIFLKRRYHLGFGGKEPVPSSESLAYGKALAYPVAAAPFVALGGLGGLIAFNWAMLALCVVCGARFCSMVMKSRAGWIVSLVFIGASIVPVYAAWLTSEIFNFTLVFVAYFLWAYKKVAPPDDRSWLTRPNTTLAAALLIGIATFSKATNAALVAPFVLDVLWSGRLRRSIAVAMSISSGAASHGSVSISSCGLSQIDPSLSPLK